MVVVGAGESRSKLTYEVLADEWSGLVLVVCLPAVCMCLPAECIVLLLQSEERSSRLPAEPVSTEYKRKVSKNAQF